MSKIPPSRPDIVEFMSLASSHLNQPLPAPKDVFSFGHDNLLAKALRGTKTATTSWPVPEPLHWGIGDYSVMVDSKDEPRGVMVTKSFVRCKFKDVEEEFALNEDEGSLEDYRRGHYEWYGSQEGGEHFGEESEVLCERFEVVYPVREKKGEEERGK